MLKVYSPSKRKWDTLIAVLTTYRAAEVPFRMAFGYQPTLAITLLDAVCCFVFFADIILHFHTSFYDHGREIKSRKRIAQHYLSSWFIFDLLGSIPFSFLIQWGWPIHEVWQWTALARLMRLGEYSYHLLVQQTATFLLKRLLIFLFWVALIVHLIACGWIILEGVTTEEGAFGAYLRSVYWTVTTLSTTGYGDIVAKTKAQTIFSTITMLIGTGIYATIIANAASMITRMDGVRAAYQEKMEKLHAFMRYKKVPESLRQQIVKYYSYSWEKGLGYDQTQMMAELPSSLRKSLMMHLSKDLLEKVPLFRNAKDEILSKLVSCMKTEVFMPGDYIFKRGEKGTAMYFINHGKVEVLDSEDDILAILDEGDFFGEVALLSSQPRNASVQALEFCTLYSLDREALELVLKEFPDFAKKIKATAEKRK